MCHLRGVTSRKVDNTQRIRHRQVHSQASPRSNDRKRRRAAADDSQVAVSHPPQQQSPGGRLAARIDADIDRWIAPDEELDEPGAVLDLQFYADAAAKGDVEAMIVCGAAAWQDGDRDTAGLWWRRAADDEYPDAMLLLGHHAWATADPQAANRWYRRAADEGYPEALMALADLAAEQHDQTVVDAALLEAAREGHGQAMFEMGRLAWEGNNIDFARRWLLRAAHLGHVQAVILLADLEAAYGEASTADLWRRLAATCHGKPHRTPRRRIEDPKVRDAVQRALWWDEDAIPTVVMSALSSTGYQPGEFDRVDDYLPDLIDAPDTTPAVLTAVSRYCDDEIRAAVAECPRTPATLLAALTLDPSRHVVHAAVDNPTCPTPAHTAGLEWLVHAGVAGTRAYIASTNHCPQHILVSLAAITTHKSEAP